MPARQPVAFMWSGGKDSAYALHKMLENPQYEVHYLLSTFNARYHRLSMHGIRESLVDQQAAAIGIPLIKTWVEEGSNDEYEKKLAQTLQPLKEEGIDTLVFGDIFLEDLRTWREQQLASLGMKALFPLWKKDTRQLVTDFINEGFVTYTCCVNANLLTQDHVGRKIDHAFIKSLPEGIDPCGENGEFHSFCTGGPIFDKPLHFEIGETIYREMEPGHAFWYCDFKDIPDR